ncbi:MAG: pyruvate kinase [Candidatus Parvarchaeum acidiphilum ARMAN-4]|uniref:Pyruvate kinase n=1 Tax=Candidatus Parvarchaeum acidiphilum ARMAN-4 TaxID=662760 RepID=D2EG75_PARA4|nr:MAG: pyruvate kinase [Candidatus Parvarchaeum acidiphilum ARMAN-4]
MLKQLILEGVDIFRFNLSHGDEAYFKKAVANLRQAESDTNRKVLIFFDLPGPKLRTGKVHNDKLIIKEGTEYTFGKNGQIEVSEEIIKSIKLNNKLLVSDGKLEFKPIRKEMGLLIAKAVNSGTLLNEQSINFKGISYPGKYPTKKDEAGIKLGLSLGIDTFALSFIASAKDITSARKIAGENSTLIAKIERPEAVKNFNEIVKLIDVVMVARGDLGLNIDIADLPEIQKRLISICNENNKPVITATQMLESMTNNVIPTRAEADDVFTAISEGTDAVMLSEETAIGVYPLKALKMLRRIISKYKYSVSFKRYKINDEHEAILNAVIDISINTKIKNIITFTSSGRSAFYLAKHQVPLEMLAFTDKSSTFSRFFFSRNVQGILVKDLEEAQKSILKIAKEHKIKRAILISSALSNDNSTESIRIIKF